MYTLLEPENMLQATKTSRIASAFYFPSNCVRVFARLDFRVETDDVFVALMRGGK